MPTITAERLLITGATGFVGRKLVRALLDDGHAVGAIVRHGSATSALDPRATVLVVDSAGEQPTALVEGFRPDAAIHAATHYIAQHAPSDILPMVEANILFGCRFLDSLRQAGVDRLVNFGTNWQHFGGPGYRPVSLYAATKQAFEDLAAFYIDAYGLRMLTLELTDTYGADDRRAKLIPHLIKIAGNGTELPMSPGDQLVTFVHIDDVVEAVRIGLKRTAANTPGAEAFAVAGDEVISLRAFVERVGQAIGRPLAVKWGARPYRDREVMTPWIGPRLPGWSPRSGLSQGLRDLVEHV